jgi:hypothetical protein
MCMQCTSPSGVLRSRLLYSNCDNRTLDHLCSSRIPVLMINRLMRVFSSQFVKLYMLLDLRPWQRRSIGHGPVLKLKASAWCTVLPPKLNMGLRQPPVTPYKSAVCPEARRQQCDGSRMLGFITIAFLVLVELCGTAMATDCSPGTDNGDSTVCPCPPLDPASHVAGMHASTALRATLARLVARANRRASSIKSPLLHAACGCDPPLTPSTPQLAPCLHPHAGRNRHVAGVPWT